MGEVLLTTIITCPVLSMFRDLLQTLPGRNAQGFLPAGKQVLELETVLSGHSTRLSESQFLFLEEQDRDSVSTPLSVIRVA